MPRATPREQFKRTGIPYYTDPENANYLCSFCDSDLPDGAHVAVITDDQGELIGVVASTDSNPFTPAQFAHRCGTGEQTVPDEIAHHDSSSAAARQARIQLGAYR